MSTKLRLGAGTVVFLTAIAGFAGYLVLLVLYSLLIFALGVFLREVAAAVRKASHGTETAGRLAGGE